jgi:hypothetical protein
MYFLTCWVSFGQTYLKILGHPNLKNIVAISRVIVGCPEKARKTGDVRLLESQQYLKFGIDFLKTFIVLNFQDFVDNPKSLIQLFQLVQFDKITYKGP